MTRFQAQGALACQDALADSGSRYASKLRRTFRLSETGNEGGGQKSALPHCLTKRMDNPWKWQEKYE